MMNYFIIIWYLSIFMEFVEKYIIIESIYIYYIFYLIYNRYKNVLKIDVR